MKAFEDDENPEEIHGHLEGLPSEHIVHSQVQKKKKMMMMMMMKHGEDGEDGEDEGDEKKGHQGCREEEHPVGMYH